MGYSGANDPIPPVLDGIDVFSGGFPSIPTAFPYVNSITLAGTPMPGKWTLIAAAKTFGWQIQQGTFQSGATVKAIGDELVKPKFKVELWNNGQVLLYKQVRTILLVKGALPIPASSLALGISHPELAAMGVTSVVVLTVNPLIDEGGGYWTTEVEFLQYRKPVPAPQSPPQTTPAVPKSQVIAKTNTEVEIQLAKAQVNSKSAALFGKR